MSIVCGAQNFSEDSPCSVNKSCRVTKTDCSQNLLQISKEIDCRSPNCKIVLNGCRPIRIPFCSLHFKSYRRSSFFLILLEKEKLPYKRHRFQPSDLEPLMREKRCKICGKKE